MIKTILTSLSLVKNFIKLAWYASMWRMLMFFNKYHTVKPYAYYKIVTKVEEALIELRELNLKEDGRLFGWEVHLKLLAYSIYVRNYKMKFLSQKMEY